MIGTRATSEKSQRVLTQKDSPCTDHGAAQQAPFIARQLRGRNENAKDERQSNDCVVRGTTGKFHKEID
jgi:hypothetical protein